MPLFGAVRSETGRHLVGNLPTQQFIGLTLNANEEVPRLSPCPATPTMLSKFFGGKFKYLNRKNSEFLVGNSNILNPKNSDSLAGNSNIKTFTRPQ